MYKKLFLGCALALSLCACDEIDESKRFSNIDPADYPITKNVLIEDFTGQKCINCPKASKEIATLQDIFGKEHVIAVAIHGGSMAYNENKYPIGLANNTGEEYVSHWGVEAFPNGIVDRKGGITDYPQWFGLMLEGFKKTAGAEISLTASYNASTRETCINTKIVGKTSTDAKLQIWIVENNIHTYQIEQGANYEHDHVFRAAVNGTWGENVSIKKGEMLNTTHNFKLAEKWKAENLAIVAFVYNDSEGVLQVVEATLIADK